MDFYFYSWGKIPLSRTCLYHSLCLTCYSPRSSMKFYCSGGITVLVVETTARRSTQAFQSCHIHVTHPQLHISSIVLLCGLHPLYYYRYSHTETMAQESLCERCSQHDLNPSLRDLGNNGKLLLPKVVSYYRSLEHVLASMGHRSSFTEDLLF